MDRRADILGLLADRGLKNPTPNQMSDLVGQGGVDGDDFAELIEDYAKRFSVNMDGYLWYFHHLDEPPLYRRMFAVGSDGKDLPMMAVSLDVLVEGADKGVWPIAYPDHRVEDRWYKGGWGVMAILAGCAVIGGSVAFIASLFR